LKASGKVTRAIFEEHDEAEGKKNEQNDPENAAQQSHGRKLIEAAF
jgi:hypothetical protein